MKGVKAPPDRVYAYRTNLQAIQADLHDPVHALRFALRGEDEILKIVQPHLGGSYVGEAAKDGQFTTLNFECLGACIMYVGRQ